MDEIHQAFSFSFADSALAEAGRVPLDALHRDVDAICRAAEAIQPVAQRLAVEAPRPHLAGFCYAPLASLGLEVVFPPDSEPVVRPLIRRPEDIDRLREPADYLAAPVIQERLRTAEALRRRRPDAGRGIGHLVEGPVTVATLLMGPGFFMLPYDDPARAHKLLDFSVRAMVGYAHAISQYTGSPLKPGPRGIPDDFAGMLPPSLFDEFVVPYWNRLYEGLHATHRSLHSELLRVEHLSRLRQARIDHYDPSADQYLTPAQLRDHCPCPFMLSIHPWHVHDLSIPELQEFYRKLARYRPTHIAFHMKSLDEEPKLKALLEMARQLQ